MWLMWLDKKLNIIKKKNLELKKKTKFHLIKIFNITFVRKIIKILLKAICILKANKFIIYILINFIKNGKTKKT